MSLKELLQCGEGTYPLLHRRREIAPNAAEPGGSRRSPEAARHLLLDFQHPQVPFRQVVIERHPEIREEAPHGLAAVPQPLQQVPRLTLAGTPTAAGRAGDGWVLGEPLRQELPVAVLEALLQGRW